MREFSTWSHDVNMGYLETYERSQPPEETATDIARELTYPTYLAKGANYNLGVQCLSEGADASMTIPEGHPALHSYMQASGSHQALTVEVRVPDEKESYVHYVVAREPIRDSDAWVPLSWENNKAQIVTVERHPEEIFTGEQAVPVFGDYIINNQLPPAHLLRRITVQPGSRPAHDADAVVQPRSLVSPVTPGQRLFNTWTVSKGFGYHPYFMNPQTPEEIANKVTQDLSSPLFLAEDSNYAFGVEELPEGINFPEDIPPERPVQTYIQVGGSHEAMSLEIRVPHPTDGYRQYAVAHEPVRDPNAWVTLGWDNGGKEPFTLHLHPEEIFTAEQAIPIFSNFILNNQLPPNNLLRHIDI